MNSWKERVLFVLALGLILAGCAGAGGAASSILAAVMASMLVVSCSDSNTTGQSDVVVSSDTGECSGAWEKCCSNGVISDCCCPEGMACNYGMFETCADGSCSDMPDACPGDSDVTEADVPVAEDIAQTEDTVVEDTVVEDTVVEDTVVEDTVENCDGLWEQCCLDGTVAKCCCPEGVACNYGMYTQCSETTCVGPADLCPDAPKKDPEPQQ
ncbi:MAG TPA: hypothetical protein EYN06_06195 [Myxococcales bacterium]|nr:hypothetical protein [Myxococcales bacterium]HIN86054.1 hypothetical protein [Myxococcales bacterium]